MLTENVPAISHVDGRSLGVSLFRWMGWYRDEIDEIVEDGWDGGWTPRYPHEESYVVDWYARHFEGQLEAHWTAQAKQRKPVLVENGQKIWASQFTGQRDVAYNLAYLRAVAMGLTRPEVLKAAEGARDNTPKWQANLLAVGATDKGLVLANKLVLSWQSASRSVGRIKVGSGRKEGLLDAMRRVYVRANGERQHIAAVGKVVAGL